jgi:hypothetical protein
MSYYSYQLALELQETKVVAAFVGFTHAAHTSTVAQVLLTDNQIG